MSAARNRYPGLRDLGKPFALDCCGSRSRKTSWQFQVFHSETDLRRNAASQLRDLASRIEVLQTTPQSRSGLSNVARGKPPQTDFHRPNDVAKIEYTHNNPLRRGYVDDPLAWRYSSARNYAGQRGLIDIVTDWQ